MTDLPTPDLIFFDATLQSPLKAYSPTLVRRLIAEAVAKEREACADEADHWIGFDKTAGDACDEIAAAIRARGEDGA